MASSGTYTWTPSLADIMLDAYERCGKHPNSLDVTMIVSARRSMNLLLSSWQNRGINLWKIELVSLPLLQGVANYPIDPSIVDILDTYLTTVVGGMSTDIAIEQISRNDYAMIPNKTVQNRPSCFWFDRTIVPSLTLWSVPDQNGPYTLNYYACQRPQDMNPTMGQTADLPDRMQEAFVAGLAEFLSVKWAPDRYPMLRSIASDRWLEAAEEDREKVTLTIRPDLSAYYRP